MFSNKVYDVLKFIAQIALPGLGTLYASLAGLYGLDNADVVVGTIVAVDAFLGLLLGLSSKQFNNSDEKFDGVINVLPKPGGGKVMDMQLLRTENPEDIDKHEQLLFKVNPTQ